MSRRLPYLMVTLMALGGLLAALSPVQPVLERHEVVQTRLQRLDLAGPADFGRGQFDGPLVLRPEGDSALLTLSSAGVGAYTSPPVALSMAATSVALHWTRSSRSDGRIGLTLRTSPDGQAWTPWQEVEGEGSLAAGDEVKVFGTLAATEDARYIQYRIDLAAASGEKPASLRAVSVFAFDSATAPRRSAWHLRLAPISPALATIKPLGIVSRRQWGADESLRFEASAGQPGGLIWPAEVAAVEKIVVHHTAGANVCSAAEAYCQRRSVMAINDIYHYHTVVNGWGDIGYNSLVGYDGRIYEGRHGPEPDAGEPLAQPVVAGHALGHNQRTHGIALLGDFQQESVPNLQYDSLARMVGWIVQSQLAAGGRLDPLVFSNYVRSNGEVTQALPNIVGHRDVNDTECPGDFLYARLIDLRAKAKRMVEWPPLSVDLQARPRGDTVTYHIVVDNHEPDLVRGLTIKGAVPANAEFVDSWAGSPDRNRGVFDGSVVTWNDPEGQLDPGRDRREYAFILRPRPGIARAAVETTAWVEFTAPAPGRATSEVVSADSPVVEVTDPAAGSRVAWTGQWPISRNVADYYGDAYQFHLGGDGSAAFTWEQDLFESGSYEVFAWWTPADDRATNAPYTVLAADGPHTVRVDQQGNGARWVSLGTYPFEVGLARVTLSDDADGVVIADAVRFRRH